MELRYSSVLRAVLDAPWAILPEKLQAIAELLATKAAGHEVDPAAVSIVLGGGPRAVPQKVGDVAIIPVYGTLTYRADNLVESSGVTSTQRLSAWLREALADGGVRSILLDVNSPGGTVPGVNEFAEELRAARDQKRIVAFANPMAASAAYWIASQASELVVLPSGMVGAIGIVAVHEDLSKALEEAGVKMTVLRKGKYKAEENPFEPLSAEARAAIEERMEASYKAFVKAVAAGRGRRPSEVADGFGEGRVVTGAKAVELGMADRVGTMDSVLERLNRAKQGGNLRAHADAVSELALEQGLRNLAADVRSAKER